MVPNVFVSSTVEDLLHLRDVVRDTVEELAYAPVLSEQGGVGYLPFASAVDSCYLAVQQCQLAIVLVGKRYGTKVENGLSVTHNEFYAARKRRIPVLMFVDRDVLAFKQVHDTDSGARTLYPGMDDAYSTFRLIHDMITSDVNNGVVPYGNATELRHQLKRQLAHLMTFLLERQFDPIRADLQDLLAEVKTLRHEMKPATQDAKQYLRLVRLLLEDRFEAYRSVTEMLYDGLDVGVPQIMSSRTFDALVQDATGAPPEQREYKGNDIPDHLIPATASIVSVMPGEEGGERWITYGLDRVTRRLVVTAGTLDFFRKIHVRLREEVEEKTRPQATQAESSLRK